MNKDILSCGTGGQGTVLASRILAAAAMEEGCPVHSAETIGMAQRGGSVTSHVRIGGDAYSPMIPFGAADMILAWNLSSSFSRRISTVFLLLAGCLFYYTPVSYVLKDILKGYFVYRSG